MNFFKKLFAPKEVSAAVGILDEISCDINLSGFEVVHEPIKNLITSDMNKFVEIVKRSPSIRVWVLSAVANMAGDAVESGEFHVYRGVLNPMGPGNALLKAFCYCLDGLVKEGQISSANSEKQKKTLRKNIAEVG